MNSNQTPKQRNLMITQYLRSWKFSTFNAIQARNHMKELWGIDLDWHDFAAVLAEMHDNGLATRLPEAGPDGMTVYIIN
jgi:hypothetical protein